VKGRYRKNGRSVVGHHIEAVVDARVLRERGRVVRITGVFLMRRKIGIAKWEPLFASPQVCRIKVVRLFLVEIPQEVVKPVPRGLSLGVGAPETPLADQCGVIAARLEQGRQGAGALRQRHLPSFL
jgi:hypothetical protein